jgi:hypothetical protein
MDNNGRRCIELRLLRRHLPIADNVWVLPETVIAYGQEADVKNASKAIK